jgi:hypothetical protein
LQEVKKDKQREPVILPDFTHFRVL